MFLLYLQAFFRVVLGLTFAISFLGKAIHFSTFHRTILAFDLLPGRFALPVALLFLLGEGAVVILIAADGSLLVAGFVLAILLLLIFSAALISVIARKLEASCNCFGPQEKQVSLTDIWRNLGFVMCALGGLGTLTIIGNSHTYPTIAIWGLAGLSAAIFVLIWTQIGEITQLLQRS